MQKKMILLSLISIPFLIGCNSASTTDSTLPVMKENVTITGSVPGTLIEAFCDDGTYVQVTSTQNGTSKHPFELEIPKGSLCQLVMTTNENDPENRVITPIGFIKDNKKGTSLSINTNINLDYIPLKMSYTDINDSNGDHVVDTPMTIDLNNTMNVTVGNTPMYDSNNNNMLDAYEDSDNNGIVNAYEDDDNDNILNIHDDDNNNQHPDYIEDDDHDGYLNHMDDKDKNNNPDYTEDDDNDGITNHIDDDDKNCYPDYIEASIPSLKKDKDDDEDKEHEEEDIEDMDECNYTPMPTPMPTPTPTPTPSAENGKLAYDADCAACHGMGTSSDVKNTSLAKLKNALQNGKGSMPAFPNLSADDIYAYFTMLNGGTPTPTPTPTRVLFSTDVMPIFEANCKGCHGNKGNFTVTTVTSTYNNLTNNSFITPGTPSNSIILLRASGTGHGGGTILPMGSTEYNTIKTWITEGALNN